MAQNLNGDDVYGESHTVEIPAVGAWTKGTHAPAVGQHKDDGKPAVNLLVAEFMEDVGYVMGFGAKKYAPNNYKNGIEHSRLLGSVLRHLFAYMRCEDLDPESKLPHLAHAGASLQMLYWMTKRRPDLDDRWRKDQ